MTIPQKLIDKMLLDYQATKSVHKTAKRVGLGSTTVHRLLRANGVECDGLALFRQRIRKLPEKEQLLREYAGGLSESALAKKYGKKLSRNTKNSVVRPPLRRYVASGSLVSPKRFV